MTEFDYAGWVETYIDEKVLRDHTDLGDAENIFDLSEDELIDYDADDECEDLNDADDECEDSDDSGDFDDAYFQKRVLEHTKRVYKKRALAEFVCISDDEIVCISD